MASYPNSVPSYGTLVDGSDYPQAEHINGLRQEITALADGLINGLQHGLSVSTGGLTVSTGNTVLGQNLSVAGGSTLASLTVSGAAGITGALSAGASTLSSLTVSSNAVVGGDLGVTGDLTVTGTITGNFDPPRAHVAVVTHTANQTLTGNVWTTLSWDTLTAGSTDMHSTASNSSRVTCATSTGLYHLSFSGGIQNAVGSLWGLRIWKNDTVAVMGMTVQGVSTTVQRAISVAGDVRVSDTSDYFCVQLFNGSGGSDSLLAASSSYGPPVFAVRRVSL